MLHPYTIFFEELWRETEPVDEPTGDERYEAASDELTLHRRAGSEPTGGEPATATDPRATSRGVWGAVVRLGRRHAR